MATDIEKMLRLVTERVGTRLPESIQAESVMQDEDGLKIHFSGFVGPHALPPKETNLLYFITFKRKPQGFNVCILDIRRADFGLRTGKDGK